MSSLIQTNYLYLENLKVILYYLNQNKTCDLTFITINKHVQQTTNHSVLRQLL